MTIRNRPRVWQLPESRRLPGPLPNQVASESPLIAQILYERGFTSAEAVEGFLDPSRYAPTPGVILPDMEIANELLISAITTRSKILIWGDFDVDGQTATALLIDGLRKLGADVTFYVPHRLRESHGIQIESLARLIETCRPQILLTCDTGITAHDAVDYANTHGITVVVTDHHDLPPGKLPSAAANINPKRLPADHPLYSLPGVGVAYKLMEVLYSQQNQSEELTKLLDLVALGIVADVAEQTRDTRYLLQLGLEQLRNTERIGLRALFETADLNPLHISSDNIGFQIAPRLNAAGRLDDATPAITLLTTHDPIEARAIAVQLDGLNKKRRVLQRQMIAAANEMLARQPDLLDHAGLVIHHPEWHRGLLGIVAGHLAERYHRPCVLLQSPPDEALARGSARSAPGYDIGAAITAQASLLHTYGGHPGAAGLSLPQDNINRFRRALSQTLREQFTMEAIPPLIIDAEVSLNEITTDFVEQIHRLAPFGEGNPPVILSSSNLTLDDHMTLGLEKQHRKLVVTDSQGNSQQILWWSGMEHRLPQSPFDLAFTVGWNTFQGRQTVAITLIDYRELELPEPEPDAPTLCIIDWRQEAQRSLVDSFRAKEPYGLVWAEGNHTKETGGLRRHELTEAESLLIYTSPPSTAILQAALEQVGPTRLYISSHNPSAQDLRSFTLQLLGLCKYTIQKLGGIIALDRITGATAQTEAAVLRGLHLLAVKGLIEMNTTDDGLHVAPAVQDSASGDEQEATDKLQLVLSEADAYRSFFSRPTVSIDDLFFVRQ